MFWLKGRKLRRHFQINYAVIFLLQMVLAIISHPECLSLAGASTHHGGPIMVTIQFALESIGKYSIHFKAYSVYTSFIVTLCDSYVHTWSRYLTTFLLHTMSMVTSVAL